MKMKKTRMHSSGRCTTHLLTVSQHVLLGAWVYLPTGFTYLGGYLPRGGVPAQGRGTCPRVGYLPRGCTCLGVYLPRYSPAPVNRMTDRCKNITLPQTLFAGGKNWTKRGASLVPPLDPTMESDTQKNSPS